MMDLHGITHHLLTCGHNNFIIVLITLGFLVYDRNIFGHATFLLLFTMIFNVLLKVTLQVPLAEYLDKVGYTFPSKQMHIAIVLYGWLFLSTKNTLVKTLLAMIMAGIAFALVYQQHNNIYDIIGAVIFGGVTLFIYSQIAKYNMFVSKPFMLGYIIIALLAGIMWYLNSINVLSNYVWMIFGTLCGFTISWTIFSKSLAKKPSVVSAIVGCIFIIALYYLTITFKTQLNIDYNLQWILAGILLPLIARVSDSIKITK